MKAENMDASERIAYEILQAEGHDVRKNPHPLMPDFECYSQRQCERFFEIKSIGKNNFKFPLNAKVLNNFKFRDGFVILIIDRVSKNEFMRLKISATGTKK